MSFKPRLALDYARQLARPRLLGTAEVETVAQEVLDQLHRFGWQVERQPFEFVTGVNQMIRLVVLAAEILILLIFWTWEVSVGVSVTLALLLLGLWLSVERLLRAAEVASLAPTQSSLSRLCWWLGERYQTANLVAHRPARPEPAGSSTGGVRPQLYLMAHLDSKGQFMPVIVRALLFGLLSGGALIFAAVTLLRPAWPALTSVGALAGMAALLAGGPLLFLDVNNRSPGAIDNASGLGLVLHLAEILGGDPAWRDKLDVTVLITSAEELAVMGAAAYVHANGSRLKASHTCILNFDGVGVRGRLNYVGGPGRLLDLTRQVGAELGLPLKRFGLGGVLFDHIPFARQGLDALTLTSIGSASWWVHTAHDTVDKLDEEGFRQAGAVALKVIEKLL